MTELAKQESKLPIIKGLESAEGYQNHKEALILELRPTNMIEMMLADQIVRDMWEKKRLDQYVTTLLNKKMGGIEEDLQSWWEYDHFGGRSLERNYQNVEDMDRFYKETISGLHIFRTLGEYSEDEQLDGKLTVLGMWALAQSARCKIETETLTEAGHIIPGEDGKIYPYNDEEGLHSGWMVRRAKACLGFMATKAKCTPERLIERALKRDKAKAAKYHGAVVAIEHKKKQLESEQSLRLGKALPAIREVKEDQSKLTASILDAYSRLEELKQRRLNGDMGQSGTIPTVTITNPLFKRGIVGFVAQARATNA